MAYILIVDDDEDLASAIARVLGGAGHEVRVHHSIDGAVMLMKEKKPNLLILDVMFPENDFAGFELARTLKHFTNGLFSVPILILTAINAKLPLGFGKRDIDGKFLPAADFLEKPVEFDVLRRKVAELLARTADGGDGELSAQGDAKEEG